MFAKVKKKITPTSTLRIIRHMTPLIFSADNAVRLTAGFALTAGTIAFNLLPPYLLGKTTQMMSDDEDLDIYGIPVSPLVMAGLFGAAWAMGNIFANYRTLVFSPLGPRAGSKLTSNYVNHIVDMSSSHAVSSASGGDFARATKAFVSVPTITTQLFTQILPTTVEAGIASGILTYLYGAPIGISMAGVTAIYAGFDLLTKNKITSVRQDAVNKNYLAYEGLSRILKQRNNMNMFNTIAHEKRILQNRFHESMEADSAASSIITKVGVGQAVITGLGFATIMMLVAEGVSRGEYTVDDFVLVTTYLAQFFGPLSTFGTALNQVVSSLKDLDAVFKELEVKPAIVDRYPDVKLNVNIRSARIEFKNVSYSFSGDSNVLDDISFVIEPGQKFGIVGVSGAGKSTIAELLMRFLDPTKGNIYINGQDLRLVSIKSLRQNLGLMPQRATLFDDTLLNNIFYSKVYESYVIDQEEIDHIIKKASLKKCINKLPNGIETQVGNRSETLADGERREALSEGEKQRVAIARVLVKNPAIVIADEATSSLDEHSAIKVQQNMNAHFKEHGTTSIVITHHLKNLVDADQIIVLDKGKIAERGTHQELINRKGLYADLWNQQQLKEKPLHRHSTKHRKAVKAMNGGNPTLYSGNSGKGKEKITPDERVKYSNTNH